MKVRNDWSLAFMAGANSIFYGEKLLGTGNPDTAHDQNLFERLKAVAEPLKTLEFATVARALSAVTA